MSTFSTRLSVESLGDRIMPSTVAYGDFNKDGLTDMVAVTNSTTITVSLANPDGSYTVSATVKAPTNLPIGNITVGDFNADGKLDISTSGLANNHFYSHLWLGDGDGTFGNRVTDKSGRIRDGW